MFQTGDYENGLQATPIVVDGVLYLGTPRDQIFALDAATGKLLWQYKYPLAPGGQSKGVAGGAVKIADGSNWRHASVIESYSDAEIESMLIFLKAVVPLTGGLE